MSETYHHGDLREALLRTGLDLLENGDGVPGLREIARQVGVSATACYRHFASRDALLSAIAARGFADLDTRLAGARDWIGFGQAYVQFAKSRPALFRLMFAGQLPMATDDGEKIGGAAFRRLIDTVAATASTDPDDPRTLRRAVRAWSLVHGYAMLLLDDRLPDAAQTDAFLGEMLSD